MDYSEIHFGNFEPEFDLPLDIVGKTYHEPVFEESPSSDLPDNFWFQNYTPFSLIHSNDRPGVSTDKFSEETTSNQQQQVIKKVYRMAMQGYPALELEKTLKLSFSNQDFETIPVLQKTLQLLPLIGPIFWLCWPFRSEEDARKELRRKTGIKPIFACECSSCNGCQYKNSFSTKKIFCSKLSLQIFDNVFSAPPPKTVINHLRCAEYLSPTKAVSSWDDIRAAVIFPQKNEKVRMYQQFALPKREVLTGAQYRKAIRELNLLGYNKKIQTESFEKQLFIQNSCYPLIVKVQEYILRNRQNDRATGDAIRKLYLQEDRKPALEDLCKSLREDIYLWAKLRWYLEPYGKCNDALQFLRRTMIRVPFAIMRNSCKACINNKNGFCALLETILVGYNEVIPERSRISALEMVGTDKNVDHNLIEYLKNQEKSNPKNGLLNLRQVINTHKVSQVYVGAGMQDIDKVPSINVKENQVVRWITKKIEEGNSILRVENAVKQAYGRRMAKKMIQDVVLSNNILPSVCNELCLTDYVLSPGRSVPKMSRCITCSFSDNLYCKKYNRKFIDSSVEIAPEANEFLRYFRDQPTDGSIQVSPSQDQKPLNVEMEDPGEFLEIDVRNEKKIDEDALWYEAQQQEMEVETPDVVEYENNLDIDMGEAGDGMILGDDLL